MANHRTDLERMSAMLSAVPSTTYTAKKSQPFSLDPEKIKKIALTVSGIEQKKAIAKEIRGPLGSGTPKDWEKKTPQEASRDYLAKRIPSKGLSSIKNI